MLSLAVVGAFLAGCICTSLTWLTMIWLIGKFSTRLAETASFRHRQDLLTIGIGTGSRNRSASLANSPFSASASASSPALAPESMDTRANTTGPLSPLSAAGSTATTLRLSPKHASVEDLVLARLQAHQSRQYDASAFIRRSKTEWTGNAIPWSTARLLLHYARVVNLPDEYYYIQLRHSQLSFHNQNDCVDSLTLTDYNVRLVPDDLHDFEFYSKLFPIELMPKKHNQSTLIASTTTESTADRTARPVYLFFCTSTEKEDWFLRLLFASRQLLELDWPQSPSFGSMLTVTDSCVHDGRWLSALMERLFEIEFTRQTLHSRLRAIIQQRLRRSPKSPFIKSIELMDVQIRHLPRIFKFSSAPRKSLLADPYFYCNAHLEWQDSPLSVTVDAVFSFDSILTVVDVPVRLTVTLHSIDGQILLWMKPPPSNRLWFGFHPPGPQFDFDVSPTVAGFVLDNQWAMIRDFIKAQAMTGLQDAAVVPNGLDIGLGPGLFDEHTAPLATNRTQSTETVIGGERAMAGRATMAGDIETSISGQLLRHRQQSIGL